MLVLRFTENYFLYNKYIYQVLNYITIALTLFYYGMKLLALFLQEIVNASLKSILQFKFHLEIGILLIISAIVHFGFFIHFDHDNDIHSPVIIYFLMTLGLVIICVKMHKIQRDLSGDNDMEHSNSIIDIDEKYAKSRLEEEVLDDYQRAIESIEDEFFYQPDLKLEMLEDKLKVKKYYLTQTFSVKMETSFVKYTNKKRIEYAAKLIKNDGKDSFSDIAFKVGFSSITNFNRAFMANFNKTPRQFRNELKND